MADEAPPKKAKKALKEPPAEAAAPKLPTAHEVREAKKAQLVEWCTSLGLDAEGKVDDLRKRLLQRIEAAEKPEAAPEKKAPAKEKEAVPKKPEKAEKKAAKKAPKKAEKEEAEEKEEEEEEFEPKLKPKLDDRTLRLLRMRAAKSAVRPAFRRQEWFRYKKFGDEWRKPQGGQSKLRRHFGYRWNHPSIGYRGPREVRGLHPSGFQEILIHNVRQLEPLDPARQAVRVAHGVGARKREEIEKACDDKGLRILNRTVTR